MFLTDLLYAVFFKVLIKCDLRPTSFCNANILKFNVSKLLRMQIQIKTLRLEMVYINKSLLKSMELVKSFCNSSIIWPKLQ